MAVASAPSSVCSESADDFATTNDVDDSASSSGAVDVTELEGSSANGLFSAFSGCVAIASELATTNDVDDSSANGLLAAAGETGSRGVSAHEGNPDAVSSDPKGFAAATIAVGRDGGAGSALANKASAFLTASLLGDRCTAGMVALDAGMSDAHGLVSTRGAADAATRISRGTGDAAVLFSSTMSKWLSIGGAGAVSSSLACVPHRCTTACAAAKSMGLG
eukprot:scaffold9491_cov150-Isochrysis_galbana.AAC.1